jgi:uncharacterized membrane protein
MATLTMWKFEDAEGAQRALSIAEDLQKEQSIDVLEGAVVSWPEGAKKPKTSQLHHRAEPRAFGATFWESLFDFFYFLPVIGEAFERPAAAFTGSNADVGIEDSFIGSVREKVKPGTSALFAVTSDVVLERVKAAMTDAGLRAETIETGLSDEQEKALRDAFTKD